MKKFWNIFLLSTIIISVLLTVWINYLMNNSIFPINYNAGLDNRELNICNKNVILQYYQVDTDYQGGKKAIKNELLPRIKQKKIEFGSENGYVTIRFIVTCNGEIGLFRANEIDKNRKPREFDSLKIQELKGIVSELKNWEVKTKNEKKFDSYYFINFKIVNGIITDIY